MNKELYALQQADDTLARLRREVAKLDDGTAARAARDGAQCAALAQQAALRKIQTDRRDRELTLKATEEKIAKQNGRLMTANNAHEVEALQRDLKGLAKSRGDLDEAILNLMDEEETAIASLAALESELATKTAATQQIETTFRDETARLTAELAATQKRRESLAAGLDEEHLEKFDELAKRFHGMAVAHLEKGNCSACGMTITPYNLKDAKASEWPSCDNCGRLLFIE